MRLRYSALSDVGRVRRDNQDSGYAGPHLLVIADGVGGSARGDVASATTVEVIRKLDQPPGEEMQGDMLGGLAGAIHRSHDRIAGLVAENPEIEGTSTTVTAVIFDGTHIGVGHVGDSRGYLLRDGTLSPADHRPHLRAEPDRRGPDHRGRGPRPPAPQPDPARGRRGPRARARRVHPRGGFGRPDPALLRRVLGRARRRRAGPHPRRGNTRPRRRVTDQRLARCRQLRQRHGRGGRRGRRRRSGRRGHHGSRRHRPDDRRRCGRGAADAAGSAARATGGPPTPASSSRSRAGRTTTTSTPRRRATPPAHRAASPGRAGSPYSPSSSCSQRSSASPAGRSARASTTSPTPVITW